MVSTPFDRPYPLAIKPYFDRRPWGTRDLAPLFDRQAQPGEEPFGEVWLTAGRCRVANGALHGRTLDDLCQRYGRDLVGTAAPEHNRFPLLLKFLFPRQPLSVQVHPDDATAQGWGEPCGKTECWYVVDAEAGSHIGLGLKAGTSRTAFADAIVDNRAEHLLNWVTISTGDMVYVDAGTVHTLRPGAVILETQQNSDSTYRLYDYGRGRGLHLVKGLQALRETTAAGKVVPVATSSGGERLIAAPHFVVEKYTCRRAHLASMCSIEQDGGSAQVLVALKGQGAIENGKEQLPFAAGAAVIIPASLHTVLIRPDPSLSFVRVTLPC